MKKPPLPNSTSHGSSAGARSSIEELGAQIIGETRAEKILEIACHGVAKLGGGVCAFFAYQFSQKSVRCQQRSPETLFSGTHPSLLIPAESCSSTVEVVNYLGAILSDPSFQEVLARAIVLDSGLRASDWVAKAVTVRELPLGVFVLGTKGGLSPIELENICSYLQKVSLALEAALLREKLDRTVDVDERTGLLSFRALERLTAIFLRISLRLQHPMCCVTFFEPEMDSMVLDKIRTQFRTTDLMSQRDRNTLVVVLPHTALMDALEKLRSVRVEVTAELAASPGIGIAEMPSHSMEFSELVDLSMVAAKRSFQTIWHRSARVAS